MSERLKDNLGARRIPKLRPPAFPDADAAVLEAQLTEPRPDERLEYWAKRAFRPGPIMTYLKMLTSDLSTFKSALNVGLQHLGWATSGS